MTMTYPLPGEAAPEAAVATRFAAATQSALRTRRMVNPSLRVEEATARASMQAIEQLQTNWDGYDAEPIAAIVRVNAWHLLDTFFASQLVPDVSPNANGTISLEWEVNGVVAHCQIGRTNFSMYIRPAEGETRYFSGAVKSFDNLPVAALAAAVGAQEDLQAPVTSIEYSTSRGFAFN